jgi:hypothetical protein
VEGGKGERRWRWPGLLCTASQGLGGSDMGQGRVPGGGGAGGPVRRQGSGAQ